MTTHYRHLHDETLCPMCGKRPKNTRVETRSGETLESCLECYFSSSYPNFDDIKDVDIDL